MIVYVASLNRTITEPIWETAINNTRRNGVFSVRFSPVDNGRVLVGGCSNSRIYICDREPVVIKSINVGSGLPADMTAISFVSDTDGNILVSGCNNGFIKLWDLRYHAHSLPNNRPRTPISTFVGHLDGITYIDSRNDGRYILSNSKDQSIKIWDLRKPAPSETNTSTSTNCTRFVPRDCKLSFRTSFLTLKLVLE